MDADARRAIDRRLARVEGQVRGLRRMLDQGEYCCDILTQLSATRSALEQVGAELATSHVKTCIVGHGCTEHERATPLSQEELIEELRVTLSRLVR